MKKKLIPAIVALTAAFLTLNAAAMNTLPAPKNAEVTFIVALHCQNCVKKVEANLPFEKGVTDIKVTLDDHTVWIQYNPEKTDGEKLKAAIEKLGYEVQGIKAAHDSK